MRRESYTLFLAKNVEASLVEPMVVLGEPDPLRCFIRIYYVWARNQDDASELIRNDVLDEAELVNVGAVEEIRLFEVRGDVREVVELDRGRGVCWRGGRIFFPCESRPGNG